MKPPRLPLLGCVALLFAACASGSDTARTDPPADSGPPPALIDAPPPAPPPKRPGRPPDDRPPPRPDGPTLAAREEALSEAVRLHPEDPRAWNAWAVAALERHAYETGLQRLERALALDPKSREALLNRGLAWFGLRRFGEALADFRRVLALPGASPNHYTDYRLAYQDYEKRVAAGEIDLAFPEALRRGLLPVDREALFAKWYGRIAEVAARGPGFARKYEALSEHYHVVTDDSEGLAKLAAGELETARSEFERLLPASDAAAGRRLPVTIFSRREDYVRYLSAILADPATAHLSGGSYHPVLRELILVKTPDFDQTILVLWHEGFHQYLDELIAGAPPWFNEGIADYFGAKRFGGIRQAAGDRHPLRTDALREALSTPDRARFEAMAAGGPAEFMATRTGDFHRRAAIVGRHYALSFAFVHFLLEGAGEEGRELLLTYYDALRAGSGAAAAWEEIFAPTFAEALWPAFTDHARTLTDAAPR